MHGNEMAPAAAPAAVNTDKVWLASPFETHLSHAPPTTTTTHHNNQLSTIHPTRYM